LSISVSSWGGDLGDCQDFMSPLRASKSSAGAASKAIGRLSPPALGGWTAARQEQESTTKTSAALMLIKSISLVY
jgi:hypothetical protein